MTPRFYCTEPSDEQFAEQERKPAPEESLDYSTKTDPESPFGQDSLVCECDLFWYPELQR